MDEDLARLLPEPPPPRPARRRAAIDMAMARLDGVAPVPAPPLATPARWGMRPGQVGLFASIALVAVVGIPMALDHRDVSSRPATPIGQSRVAPGDRAAAAVGLAPPPVRMAAPRQQRAADLPAAADRRGATARADPPHTVPPAIVAAPVAAETEEAPPPPPPPPPAPAAPAAASEFAVSALAVAPRAEAAAGSEIVVTGSRVTNRSAASARRSAWTDCTVDDPDRRLSACTRQLGRSGDAAADDVSDGLAKAWSGDRSAAIAAFDRALVLRPKLGVAYLNRGLLYRQQGMLDRAAADLDKAVRYDRSARSYRARAELRRQQGDAAGARRDDKRAAAADADALTP